VIKNWQVVGLALSLHIPNEKDKPSWKTKTKPLSSLEGSEHEICQKFSMSAKTIQKVAKVYFLRKSFF